MPWFKSLISEHRYNRFAAVLHWTIAALILYNLSLGWFIEDLSPSLRGFVLMTHFSAGLSVLGLTLVRILWRVAHNPPELEPEVRTWERALAHITHFLLYGAMLIMPLTGWIVISANPPPGSAGAAYAETLKSHAASVPGPAPNRNGLAPQVAHPKSKTSTFWGLVPLPRIAPLSQLGVAPGGVEPQKRFHDLFMRYHMLIAWMFIALLVMHVAGALKHQFYDRIPSLSRMSIWRTDSRINRRRVPE